MANEQGNSNAQKRDLDDIELSEYTEADYLELKSKAEELEKKAKTLEAQKSHWKKKAKTPQEKKEKPKAQDDSQWRERLELKVEGYNDDEIKFIQRNGGKEALDDAYVQKALEAIREQKKSEQAVASDDSGKSEIEKKYNKKEIEGMSVEEMEKILRNA